MSELKPLCDPLEVFTGDVIHDWESHGRWGVIIGMSRCKRCGILATKQNFEHATVEQEQPK